MLTLIAALAACSGGAADHAANEAADSDTARASGIDTADSADSATHEGTDAGGHDDTAPGDWPAVDTTACEENSASYDDCCFAGRASMPAAYLLDDWSSVAWDGDAPGLTVMTSAAELDAWWLHAGVDGRTDVDFLSEVAVGWLGESDDTCDEQHFDGLRAGDAPGSWVAGAFRWTWCGYYDGCDDYITHATLWLAPVGEVESCAYGGFCDG